MAAFSLRRFLAYLYESRIELAKVQWPTREQAIRFTAAVLAVSLVVALIMGLFDYIFTIALERLI
jgi:preprotein translocase subunit SecE